MQRLNKSGLPPQANFMIRAKRLGGEELHTPRAVQAATKPLQLGSATAPHKNDMPKFKSKHGWPNLGKF
jgi:hypothetical protein